MIRDSRCGVVWSDVQFLSPCLDMLSLTLCVSITVANHVALALREQLPPLLLCAEYGGRPTGMEFREQWQCWFEFEHTSIGSFCFNCFSSYCGVPFQHRGLLGGLMLVSPEASCIDSGCLCRVPCFTQDDINYLVSQNSQSLGTPPMRGC